jgi:Kef-type K+ transport system membrane component KefB
MGLAVSLIIAAIGLILALAVHPATTGSVDVNTVGWILFLVGVVGFVLDLVLWSSWGPGYLSRRATYVDDHAAYRRRAIYPRRRVVEEVDEPAGPPPGY